MATPSKEQFLSLFHPDDRPKFLNLLVAAEAGQKTDPIECRIVRPDGAVRWLRNVSDAIFDEQGKPTRRIGTFQDVTEMHEAQERQRQLEQSLRVAKEAAEAAKLEVQTANLELETRVEERTMQLRAAQQDLVKAERLSTLGQLTATVAHELRNPLSAIKNTIFSVAEVASRHGLSLDRQLARMERSILRCEHIITDLLDFTRAREPKLSNAELDRWLDEVLDELAVPAGIRLERRLTAPSAIVALDTERFRRVLINLVDNAVQAIQGKDGAEGQIKIATAAGAAAEIVVEDTGPGIGPDILAKIFEPLFSTKSFGTGLGLPTVKQIVEQHGGTITVESEVGRGTTVRIRLPCASVASAAA